MIHTLGVKTTASPSWVKNLLVGSDNCLCVAGLTYGGSKYLLIGTDADLVVVNIDSLDFPSRLGYATLAGGFNSVTALRTGEVFLTSVSDGKVYNIDMADVSGDSSGSLAIYLSTATGPGAIRLAGNTAFDLRAFIVQDSGTGSLPGAAKKILCVLDGSEILIVNITDETSAASRKGDKFCRGQLESNSLSWHRGRLIHTLFNVEDTEDDFEPDATFGNAEDDFSDNSYDQDFWETVSVLGAGMSASISETSQRLNMTASSGISGMASIAAKILGTWCGPFGLSIDWNVTSWPTGLGVGDSSAFFKAVSKDGVYEFIIKRRRDSISGHRIIAEAYKNDVLVESVGISHSDDSGKFRIVKSVNDDDRSLWDTSTSDYDYEDVGGVDVVRPDYKVELQYYDAMQADPWVTVYTYYTDDDTGLIYSIGVESDTAAGIAAYFDNLRIADSAPSAYSELPIDDITAAAVVADSPAYLFSAIFDEQIHSLVTGGGQENLFNLGIIDRLKPIVRETESDTSIGEACYPELPISTLTDLIFDGDESLFIACGQGVFQFNSLYLKSPTSSGSLFTQVYCETELPSQPLTDDDVVAIGIYSGDLIYASGGGCGSVSPDTTSSGAPTSAVCVDDDPYLDASWSDPDGDDFYGTVIGRQAKTSVIERHSYRHTDAGWMPDDGLSEDFGTLDDLCWENQNATISGGKMICSTPPLDADIGIVTKNYVRGIIQVDVRFEDFTAVCADAGDEANAAIYFWIDIDNYIIVCRSKVLDDGFDGYKFFGNNDGTPFSQTVSKSDASGRMVLRRRGKNVAAFYYDSGARVLIGSLSDWIGDACKINVVFWSDDANADASCVFDDLVVEGFPDYDFITGETSDDLDGDYNYFLKSVDEAGNVGEEVAVEELKEPLAEPEDDPWLDHFILAETLLPEEKNEITILTRPDEGGVRAGPVEKAETNISAAGFASMESDVSDEDFSATIKCIASGKDPQFLQKQSGGWMARGMLGVHDPIQLAECTSSGIIRSLSAATLPTGDLLIVFERSGSVWSVTISTATGEKSSPVGLVTGAVFPSVVRHEATGRLILLYSKSGESNVYRRIYAADGNGVYAWGAERLAFAFRGNNNVDCIRLCSHKMAGREKLVAAIGQDEEVLNGIIGSDDAGATWNLLAEQSAFDGVTNGNDISECDASGDLSLASGPSGLSDVLVFSFLGSWDDAMPTPIVYTSVDGEEWTRIGPYWGSGFSDDNNNARRLFSLCPAPSKFFLPQTLVDLGELETQAYRQGTIQAWFALSRYYQRNFKLELTAFITRSPGNWYALQVLFGFDGDPLTTPDELQEGFGTMGRINVLNGSDVESVWLPYIRGIELLSWNDRIYALILAFYPNNWYRLHLVNLIRWQGPPDKSSYDYFWYSGLSQPQVSGEWTRTASGTYSAGFDDGMLKINCAAAALCYYELEFDGNVILPNPSEALGRGIKIKSGFKISDADANTKVGIEFLISDDGYNYIKARILFTGRNTFRVWDMVLNDWASDEYTLGISGDEYELLFGAGDYDGSTMDFNLWTRVCSDNRILADFTSIADGSLRKANNGSPITGYIRFGVLAAGNPAQVSFSHIAFSQYHDDMHIADTEENGEVRGVAAGGHCLPISDPIDLGGNVKVIPQGPIPETGDQWTLTAQGAFPFENVFKPNSAGWRSADDDTGQSVVCERTQGFIPGGVALFGSNFYFATAEFNNTNVWTSPSVTVSLESWMSTGKIGSHVGDSIKIVDWARRWRPGTGKTNMDDDWASNLQDHELVGLYLKMTSGVALGRVYKIQGNSNGYMTFDGDLPTDDGATTNDEFVIFGKNMVCLPHADQLEASKARYRYMRLTVWRTRTYEGYYQLKSIAVGPLHLVQSDTTCRTWADLSVSTKYPSTLTRMEDGTLYPKSIGAKRREVTLKWNGFNPSQKIGFQALMDLLNGPEMPVVYLPVFRRNESVAATRGCYEAVLARIPTDKIDVKPMGAVEVWEHAAVTLEEIPT